MTRSADIERAYGGRFRLSCRTLWRRELVRFLRQRSRVIGALATPVVFWLLAGSVLGDSFKGSDSNSASYLEYTFPAAVGSILLFTAIFSMISLIEDRREGFMQAVLVAPVPRASIVLGKVLGTTTLAVGQGAAFVLLAPLANIPLSVASFVGTVAAMFLMAFAVSSLGFWIAWRLESTQGFHAIMNLLLLPMLFLSGAFSPPEQSSTWVRWIIAVNPMTYSIALLRRALCLDLQGPDRMGIPGLFSASLITVGFAAIMFAMALWSAVRDTSRTVV